MTENEIKQYPAIKARIKRLKYQKQGETVFCGAVTGSHSEYPYTKRTFPVKEYEAAMPGNIQKTDTIAEELINLKTQKQKIESFINDIQDITISEILTRKYILGESWEMIAAAFEGVYSVDSLRKKIKRFFS